MNLIFLIVINDDTIYFIVIEGFDISIYEIEKLCIYTKNCKY